MDLLQASFSTRTTSVATSPNTPFKPTNDDIEAVIKMATAARQNPDGRSVPPRDTRTQLFVGNLPYRVRWQDLKDLFRRAGTVLRADVSLGPDNRSRGYGTVLLATAEEAGRAVDMFNGYSWQTRVLEVRPDRLPPDVDKPFGNVSTPTILPALPPLVHGPTPLHWQKRSDDFDYGSLLNLHDMSGSSSCASRSLFVGNLPFHCQWQDLKDLFRQAGTITRADVVLGPDGRSRGFGTVIFATELDAERAMKMFNGYEYNGRTLKVHFDKFTSLAQGASYPTSPSLHPVHAPTTSLTSMSLNNLISNSPSFGVPSFGPTSQAAQYQLNYSPSSRSSSSPERDQAPAPPPQRQQQMLSRGFNSPAPSLATDLARVTGPSLRLRDGMINLNTPSLREKIPSESTSASTSRSASRAPSSLSSNEGKRRTDKSAAPSESQHHHPHRPGPIALPPPAPVPFPFALHRMLLQHESTPSAQTPVFNAQLGSQQTPMTPHGLPPITPTMPPFTFLPPRPSPQQQHPSQAHVLSDAAINQTHSPSVFGPQIPSPLEHPSSPSYHAQYSIDGFSAGAAMSPGAFWGRPGNPNPHINPAVGAPVHTLHPSSPGHYTHPMSSPNRQAWRGEPTGYFDPEYFPRDIPHSPYVSSNLANEILKDGPGSLLRDIQDDDPKESRDYPATQVAKPDNEHDHQRSTPFDEWRPDSDPSSPHSPVLNRAYG